jgi:hypothetical protein
MLVNTVVGFIGPEYLYDGKQIARAGLEDHFCGKLLGLPMGCDVCYTNHAEADQDDMDTLLTLLGAAGVNYIMGVPGADDIMLNYQSTSFHDALYLRRVLGLRPAPEFEGSGSPSTRKSPSSSSASAPASAPRLARRLHHLGSAPGRTDAERNCISNIRAEGLSYAQAAAQLGYYLTEARRPPSHRRGPQRRNAFA